MKYKNRFIFALSLILIAAIYCQNIEKSVQVEIWTCSDLLNISPSRQTIEYHLMDDLDCKGLEVNAKGDEEDPFESMIIEGNNRLLSNLKIVSRQKEYGGNLF